MLPAERFQRYLPAPPLDGLIRCLWYSEGANVAHTRERLLPNGELTLVFTLQEEAIRIYDANDPTRYACYGQAVFCGARADCFVIDVTPRERVMGVQFRPGGAFPFLRMPVVETSGGCLRLNDLWQNVRSLQERLLGASSDGVRFGILERALAERLLPGRQIHPAVAHAVRRFQITGQQSKIADLADQAGLSARRFIELFQRQVGLTPKTFARLQRFQQVVTAVKNRSNIEWSGVALDCGYYDQAHFIHDFRKFSGLTPSVYLASATSHLNHVPMP